MRTVQKADRVEILRECDKADRILQEIYFIANAWEEDLFNAEEWKVAKKIKESITANPDQHAIWGDLQPWDHRVDGETA